jgi:hypothetical protein
MTRWLTIFSFAALLSLLPSLAGAQVDKFAKPDTLLAEVGKIDPLHWTITVSYTNDEQVVALSVPLRMTAGLNRIVADSAVFIGGRVQHFAYNAFRADTAVQCVLLGMIANFGGATKKLEKGSGRLATIFISSLDKKPIEKLVVDTTTVHPNNSLMAIADSVQGTPPDTVTVKDRKDLEIIPVFVTKVAQ